ncbi:RTA1-domain-containing protein [Mollisia scopiformis]|uniref:RTA1-domain-containing protein n=1 Tax=Mollisia scopiformis TaxID=149040 RepID=A0A194XAT6_MOLSC|nr:RTA1-domain-containing protein [Mollisia scopiformis]KUJ16877.1 RTA1-domain-containing protein [Mollisia scopiformis]
MLTLLPRTVANTQNFTKETCSVGESVYGYYPSQPVNVILVAIFAISFIANLFQGIKSRSWTFTIALGVGTSAEAVGYIGRLLLRNDPFNKAYMGIQLVCLTVAPAFIAAGIYLTLKYLVIVHGVGFSRLPPKWYTRIFISCDIVSIIVQTAGAGMASGGPSMIKTGNDVMMIGLAFQVVTLAIFRAMALHVWSRISKYKGELSHSTKAMRNTKRFKGLIAFIIVVFTTILIRCIYRVAEMAGGWGNRIMQNQVSFIVLDGVMCFIAVLALNVFHPGFLFQESHGTVEGGARDSTVVQKV